MIRRREFITLIGGAAAAWPRAARGRQTLSVPRVGLLLANEESDRDLQARLAGLRQGLERLGWSDGRNIRMDYRFSGGNPDRYQPLARELVASRPNLIIAQTPPVVAAVLRETHEIPIVFVDVSDAIGAGFIASLARPGGNLTGLLSFEASIVGKWLAMLKEVAPKLAHVALIGNPKATPFDYFQQAAAATAPSLGIELASHRVENAADITHAVESVARASNGGLIFPPDTTIILYRDLVVALAAQHRLPTVYPFRAFVDAGGLMSYSIDVVYGYRLLASYVDRILRGAKPADLPVQTPPKFETVINLKTAMALGLTLPPDLLVAADEVIE